MSHNGQQVSTLSIHQKLAFSVGHVLNDLCSAMWFSYLLVYFHFVKQFHNSLAGYLLLIGQVADAISTPFVGLESDKNHDWWFCKYGKRKSWHLLGTICVLISFTFIFNQCIGCENSHKEAQLVYYAAFIIIFQFGWASVQISHLSLIPEITPHSHERFELNAFRYALTVASNITVYIVTWIFLKVDIDSNSNPDTSDYLTPADATHFRNIVFIVVFIGALFSIIFHIGVKEKPQRRERSRSNLLLDDDETETETDSDVQFLDLSCPSNHLKWRHWLKEGLFYKVALLYMGTRLCINLTQVYIPLYLQDSLHLTKQSIAYIPLVMYCSGFVSSFLMKYLNVHIGKKITYFLGSLMSLIASIWLYFGGFYGLTFFKTYEIYGVASLMGIAGSTMLITSLSITNDLIGHNTSSGAFVFGAMSFMDKLSNGLAVIVIENFHPCQTCGSSSCDNYYRDILAFVCGGATIISLVALAMLAPHQIGVSLSSHLPSSTSSTSRTPRTPNGNVIAESPKLIQDTTHSLLLSDSN